MGRVVSSLSALYEHITEAFEHENRVLFGGEGDRVDGICSIISKAKKWGNVSIRECSFWLLSSALARMSAS